MQEPTEAYVGKRRDGDTREVIGIDPGKNDLLYAVGTDDNHFRYTQKQRDSESGFTQKNRACARLKAETFFAGQSVEQIESELTAFDKRTCHPDRWYDYLLAKRNVEAHLEGFYTQTYWRKRRWHSDINSQRSLAKMVSAFSATFGGPEKVIVGFGDWSHNALRNQPPTMSIGIRRALRSLGGFDVLMVNEYRTSKACSKVCGGDCERFRHRIVGDPGSLVWGLTRCTTCGELWNRDYNGARNIRLAAIAARDGEERPLHLRPQNANPH